MPPRLSRRSTDSKGEVMTTSSPTFRASKMSKRSPGGSPMCTTTYLSTTRARQSEDDDRHDGDEQPDPDSVNRKVNEEWSDVPTSSSRLFDLSRRIRRRPWP